MTANSWGTKKTEKFSLLSYWMYKFSTQKFCLHWNTWETLKYLDNRQYSTFGWFLSLKYLWNGIKHQFFSGWYPGSKGLSKIKIIPLYQSIKIGSKIENYGLKNLFLKILFYQLQTFMIAKYVHLYILLLKSVEPGYMIPYITRFEGIYALEPTFREELVLKTLQNFLKLPKTR